MQALLWVPLFLAIPASWRERGRWLGLILAVVGYATAAANGLLGAGAWAALALLAAVGCAVTPGRPRALRMTGHVVFLLLALPLSMHWIPGFHNPRVISGALLTPDAVPFSMYLNLDKPLVGLWLLLCVPWVRAPRSLRMTLQAGIAALLGATLVCLALALLLGIVAWAPKWPAQTGLWLVNNLLFVTCVEEAFFRGYLQEGLNRLAGRSSLNAAMAIGVSALLFGLIHFAGGWQWIVLATVAGIGYGIAYRFGGLGASVLAHFGLNAAHFFFFTYPMLMPAVRG